MPWNSYQSNSIPTAVAYVTPIFDAETLKNIKSRDDLNRYILAQTQGESVLLYENLDIPSLMYITNIIYTSSPELVFVAKDGLKIQIFNFISEEEAIRPADIMTSFAFLGDDLATTELEENLTIDITKLWEQQTGEDIGQNLYNCIQEILKLIKNVTKATLIGFAPAALFLLSQHYLAGKTKELWYQEKYESKPMRIY